jgi:hypothetical protein
MELLMKLNLISIVATLTTLFPVVLAAEDKIPFSQTDEGKVLAQFEGHWQTEGGDKNFADDSESKWVLRNRARITCSIL